MDYQLIVFLFVLVVGGWVLVGRMRTVSRLLEDLSSVFDDVRARLDELQRRVQEVGDKAQAAADRADEASSAAEKAGTAAAAARQRADALAAEVEGLRREMQRLARDGETREASVRREVREGIDQTCALVALLAEALRVARTGQADAELRRRLAEAKALIARLEGALGAPAEPLAADEGREGGTTA